MQWAAGAEGAAMLMDDDEARAGAEPPIEAVAEAGAHAEPSAAPRKGPSSPPPAEMSALFGDGGGGGRPNLVRDICLVISPLDVSRASGEERAELQRRLKERNRAFRKLRRRGLDLRVRRGRPGGAFAERSFVLIGAPEPALEAMASKIGLEKKLLPEYADTRVPIAGYTGYEEYSTPLRHIFLPGPDTFFTSQERQRVIFQLIEAPGRLAVDLDGLVVDGVIDDYFALPSLRRQKELLATWANGPLLGAPPLDDIRDYFGEKVAFYFAWLKTYTQWLGGLSLLSLVFAGVQAYYGLVRSTLDTPIVPAYAVCLALWCVLFTEAWKREQAVLAFVWNVSDFEEEEPPRPEFMRAAGIVTRTGVFNARGFVEIEPEELRADPARPRAPRGGADGGGGGGGGGYDDRYVPELRHLVFPAEEYRRRIALGVLSTVLMAVAAVVGTLFIMTLKLVLGERWHAEGGPVVAAVLNSAFITVMNYAWAWVSVRLNTWETHRTDTAYEDALIWKTFAFQFVNSYISLFYIAYVQGTGFPLFGFSREDGSLFRDYCPRSGREGGGGSDPSEAAEGDCMSFLFIQLAVQLTSKQLTRFIFSLAPGLWAWYRSARLSAPGVDASARRDESQLLLLEGQATLAPYPGTFYEFSEMAIQFGYCTMFAAAFPFGAVICFLTNLAERKSDATKLLKLSRRPRYRGAEDIGTWERVFVLLSQVAVLTNALIILFTSRLTRTALQGAFETRANAIVFIVFIEHLVFAAQALLAHLVPDVPFWVDAAKTRKDVKRKERLRVLSSEEAEWRAAAAAEEEEDDEAEGLLGRDDGSDDDDEGRRHAIGPSGSQSAV